MLERASKISGAGNASDLYLITGLGARFCTLGEFLAGGSTQGELLSMNYSEYDLDYAIQNAVFDSQELLEYVRLFNTPTVGASGAVYGVSWPTG